MAISNEVVTAIIIIIVPALMWVTQLIISERLKNGIKSEYDKKMREFEYGLKAKSDGELERLRSQLSVIAAQRNITFNRLHEERALVLAEAYARLKALYIALREYTDIHENGATKEERRDAFVAAYKRFDRYFQKRVIFLPVDTASLVEKITAEIRKSFHLFLFMVESDGVQEKIKTWMDVYNTVQVDIKAALSELEKEFRHLLGDTDHPQPSF